MGDEPRGFQNSLLYRDAMDTEKRPEGVKERHPIVLCFAVHATVPQLGVTQIVSEL